MKKKQMSIFILSKTPKEIILRGYYVIKMTLKNLIFYNQIFLCESEFFLIVTFYFKFNN